MPVTRVTRIQKAESGVKAGNISISNSRTSYLYKVFVFFQFFFENIVEPTK